MGKIKHPKIDEVRWRAKPWRVRHYDKTGKRVSAFFESKEIAVAYACEVDREEALPLEMSVSNAERIALYRLREIGAARGITAEKLLELSVETAKAYRPGAGKLLSDAITEFLDSCKKRNFRASSIQTHKWQLTQLERYFPGARCADVTRAKAKVYLEAQRSPLHARKALSALFEWCADVGRGYVEINPVHRLSLRTPLKDAKPIPVLTPEHAAHLMAGVPAPMRAGFALMAFAGVRPGELVRDGDKKDVLTWGSVDFARGVISIPASVAKTRKPRRLYDLPPNLWAWLSLTPKEQRHGRILPYGVTAVMRARDKARRGAPTRAAKPDATKPGPGKTVSGKVLFEMPTDVLRHSFCSYAYHTMSAERAVEISGHSMAVFRKHYKGMATPEDAAAYFAIVP